MVLLTRAGQQGNPRTFANIKSAFHLSGLTGPGELVLPGPNGKAVASLRDYARDMTCLRGQLRVFRKQTNKHGGCAVFPDCLRVFLLR